jgi:hypothetical protein
MASLLAGLGDSCAIVVDVATTQRHWQRDSSPALLPADHLFEAALTRDPLVSWP